MQLSESPDYIFIWPCQRQTLLCSGLLWVTWYSNTATVYLVWEWKNTKCIYTYASRHVRAPDVTLDHGKGSLVHNLVEIFFFGIKSCRVVLPVEHGQQKKRGRMEGGGGSLMQRSNHDVMQSSHTCTSLRVANQNVCHYMLQCILGFIMVKCDL